LAVQSIIVIESSPEKAGVGGSTPSLATILNLSVPETWITERSGLGPETKTQESPSGALLGNDTL